MRLFQLKVLIRDNSMPLSVKSSCFWLIEFFWPTCLAALSTSSTRYSATALAFFIIDFGLEGIGLAKQFYGNKLFRCVCGTFYLDTIHGGPLFSSLRDVLEFCQETVRL